MTHYDGYNGWTNYETWTVKLWMDNDGNPFWGLLAEEYKNDVYELAQRIKEEIEEGNPLNEEASMYSQLLNSALEEVNWQEIAESLLEE